MNSAHLYDSLIAELASLTRPELLHRLTHFTAAFPLDFSQPYLNACETDRLRHLLLAAEWHSRARAQAVSAPCAAPATLNNSAA